MAPPLDVSSDDRLYKLLQTGSTVQLGQPQANGEIARLASARVCAIEGTRVAVEAPEIDGVRFGPEAVLLSAGLDALYAFPSTVEEPAQDPKTIWLTIRDAPRRLQRRKYYRVDGLTLAVNAQHSNERLHDAFIMDLSGGGARLCCRRQLGVGDTLWLEFQLPAAKPVSVITKAVVRVPAQPEFGVEFSDLPAAVRDAIVSWALQVQRQRLRRKAVRLEDLSIPVKLFVGPDRHAKGVIQNLSGGGARIRGTGQIQAGERASLEFALPGARPILARADAIVRWVGQAEFGVEFTSLSDTQYEVISSWILQAQHRRQSKR